MSVAVEARLGPGRVPSAMAGLVVPLAATVSDV
jgi:hypothetical protein